MQRELPPSGGSCTGPSEPSSPILWLREEVTTVLIWASPAALTPTPPKTTASMSTGPPPLILASWETFE